jgi:hypothetical protein
MLLQQQGPKISTKYCKINFSQPSVKRQVSIFCLGELGWKSPPVPRAYKPYMQVIGEQTARRHAIFAAETVRRPNSKGVVPVTDLN